MLIADILSDLKSKLSSPQQMTRGRPGEQGYPVTLRASADGSGQAVRVVLELAEGKLAALERSEERFRRIVHSADEGIWEIDAQSRTSFVNPKMASMLGYAIEDMVEQPLTAFMDDEGRAILERNIAQRQQGIRERHEFKFLRSDGAPLWATLATNPIFDAEGGYLGALAQPMMRALTYEMQVTGPWKAPVITKLDTGRLEAARLEAARQESARQAAKDPAKAKP
eukprot:gene32420-36600_t